MRVIRSSRIPRSSTRRARLVAALALLLAPCADPGATAEEGEPAATPTCRTRIDLRIDPVADLLQHVRGLAEQQDADVDPALADAVDAVRTMREDFGRGAFFAFEIIDRQLLGVAGFPDLAARLAALPEEVEVPGGAAPLGPQARRLAAALETAGPWFLAERWPARERALREVAAYIDATFHPREAACFAYMLECLAVEDPAAIIPVYLVHDGPWPGAHTYDDGHGGGFCFVAIREHQGTLLLETMLHEATHAIDVTADARVVESGSDQDPARASVFARLRADLTARGLTFRDRALRDIPHTLMFVQAGETIRRHVDNQHVHYGDAADYYSKVAEVAAVEREEWIAFLDGDATREDALRRIVDRLAPPPAEDDDDDNGEGNGKGKGKAKGPGGR